MPFKSAKQRKFMHARLPKIAARWENEAKAKHRPAVVKKGKKK
jgi:hypothetical protein